MSEFMECRECRALVDAWEQICTQCGSALLAGAGTELAHQLAAKREKLAFVATYHTWPEGSWNGVGFDMERNRMVVQYTEYGVKSRRVIQGEEILGVRVLEAAGATHTKTSGSSMVGRAVLGGMMFGGVGAMIGGNTAKQTSTGTVSGIEVLITTQVDGFQLVSIPILASEHRADSSTVNHYRKVAAVWVSRVDTILRQCAQQTSKPAQSLGSSVADELGKLVWLRDHGEITMQEFDLLKRQLLANRNAE